MNALSQSVSEVDGFNEDTLFARIAEDILQTGYSINPAALPPTLTEALYRHSQLMSPSQFVSAGIGRADDYLKNDFVRTDEICWITGESEAGTAWLHWCAELQKYLNRRLFLGLFSFESHFAHYKAGDFYKRHVDAFKGESNRKLSVVVYLNSNWYTEDGGELVIYQNWQEEKGIRVTPLMGTVVVFLSEEFPHEVLPAKRDRYSIAGWFRVNTSVAERVDPPQ
ncbi:2OG-Fe(II) oxygenase [Teredinibacter sp. KSP-S5-2]|uniref:2OG-Fe(II) oxygenase n=1 Tax=Teredinibacter sp. KSP-S5-2 TaxID=3034506 RepID=UPI0029341912|nr:2OG-Fe(II) oxygenase [Teredinibacter sp. KSP-S5-2]WNO10777.1 2OG-Fe(II) oxygenase [Teredinibacter sp. KSP-S5-2]